MKKIRHAIAHWLYWLADWINPSQMRTVKTIKNNTTIILDRPFEFGVRAGARIEINK